MLLISCLDDVTHLVDNQQPVRRRSVWQTAHDNLVHLLVNVAMSPRPRDDDDLTTVSGMRETGANKVAVVARAMHDHVDAIVVVPRSITTADGDSFGGCQLRDIGTNGGQIVEIIFRMT
jgi:hypothetical protein